MKEIYHFKVELKGHVESLILCVKPAAYGKKINIFSNYFKELNVPVKIENASSGLPIKDSFDLEYRFVFENSFTKKVKNYDISSKRNLPRVLMDLGRAIDEDLRGALCFKNTLNKMVRVVSDNGVKTKRGARKFLPFDGKCGKSRKQSDKDLRYLTGV